MLRNWTAGVGALVTCLCLSACGDSAQEGVPPNTGYVPPLEQPNMGTVAPRAAMQKAAEIQKQAAKEAPQQAPAKP